MLLAKMTGDFEYTLRRSNRARHVRLRVTPREGLVVVVPSRYPERKIPALLRERRDWIEGALERVAPHMTHLANHSSADRPQRLDLAGIGESWTVEYRMTAAQRISVTQGLDHTLVLSGPVDDPQLCRAAVKRWLTRTARDRLVPRLLHMGDQQGYTVQATSVRWQRTRWASCSARASISINAKLLFLPQVLVDHVLLHELCHTVHLNHSSAFWDLFEGHEPGCRSTRRELRDGWRHVPAWIEAEG